MFFLFHTMIIKFVFNYAYPKDISYKIVIFVACVIINILRENI